MQLEDRVPEVGQRLGDRVLCSRERRLLMDRFAQLLEIVAGREEVLHRVVVECLRKPPPLPLLGRLRLREQRRARFQKIGDRACSAGEKRGEKNACDTHPGEKAGVGDDEPLCPAPLPAGCASDWATYATTAEPAAIAVKVGQIRNATTTGTNT